MLVLLSMADSSAETVSHIKKEPDELDQPVVVQPQEPRKTSNASTVSDDSLRKMSNDSGISAMSTHLGQGHESPVSSGPIDDLIGEPRLSSMQNLIAQQSLAAASLNSTLFGMSPSSFLPNSSITNFWSHPLATAALMQQQQEATRKVIESANGKMGSRPFKQYPKDPLSFPLYPIPGLIPPNNLPTAAVGDSTSAFTEVLKAQEQVINAYKSQVLNHKSDENSGFKAARKSHSFSGSCSPASLVNSGLYPTTPNGVVSPQHRQSPSSIKNQNHSTVDDRVHVDDDQRSVGSGKSSVNSFDMRPTNGIATSQHSDTNGHLTAAANGRKESSRKRKIGSPLSDGMPLSEVGIGLSVNSQSVSGSLSSTPPINKLSTTSLPTNLPSSGRCSASRKRPRTLPDEEKDETYWERRRKNNEAAKRSRDSRRAKEDEIAIRAAFLEQENLRLRVEMASMRQEMTKLQSKIDACNNKNNKCDSKQESPPSSSPSDVS